MLNDFDTDATFQDDIKRLQDLQDLYRLLQKNFEKRGEKQNFGGRTGTTGGGDTARNFGAPQIFVLDLDKPKYGHNDAYSPSKQNVIKNFLTKPKGETKDELYRLKSENSIICLEDISTQELDEDFKMFDDYLNMREDFWELGFKNDYIKIFKQRELNKNEMIIKCQAILPNINK